MKTMEIKVEGMTCGHCVMTVEKALKEIGVQAKVSLENKNAQVEFDENNVTVEDMRLALDEAGYKMG